MNGYEEVLLVGGLADGRIIKVSPSCRTYEIPKLTMPLVKFHDEFLRKDFETERYEIELIHGESETFKVFKSSTISVDVMIKKLIEGYKP